MYGTVNGDAGDDLITISKKASLVTGSVNGGEGNDDIYINAKSMSDMVSGGAGNDDIFINSKAFGGDVDGGSGSDTVTLFRTATSSASFDNIETINLASKKVSLDADSIIVDGSTFVQGEAGASIDLSGWTELSATAYENADTTINLEAGGAYDELNANIYIFA